VTSGAGRLRPLPLFVNWEAARRHILGMGEGSFIYGGGFGHEHTVREICEAVSGHLALGVVLRHLVKKVYTHVFPH